MRLEEQERSEWKLTDEHLEAALRSLRVTGYVIFEGVLSEERVNALRTDFLAIFERYVAQIGDNRGKQRQGGVPLTIEGLFADPEIVGNPLVLSILDQLLGADIVCTYFSSDTPMPGSEYQPVHRDGKDLFPGVPVTVPPFMYELNIPLVDFRVDNGPLEVWPRTHLVVDFPLGPEKQRDELRVGRGQIRVNTESGRPVVLLSADARATEVQEFADGLQGQQVLMPAGSFLIRDPRMWHRGTPNRSNEARPMLSLAYGRPWYRFNAVEVSRDVYDAWPKHVQELFRLACIEGELSREFA
jgi:ectoine hydroxylase-related dioxygenase (phytanoyl-CoA dioxygenase family)